MRVSIPVWGFEPGVETLARIERKARFALGTFVASVRQVIVTLTGDAGAGMVHCQVKVVLDHGLPVEAHGAGEGALPVAERVLASAARGVDRRLALARMDAA